MASEARIKGRARQDRLGTRMVWKGMELGGGSVPAQPRCLEIARVCERFHPSRPRSSGPRIVESERSGGADKQDLVCRDRNAPKADMRMLLEVSGYLALTETR